MLGTHQLTSCCPWSVSRFSAHECRFNSPAAASFHKVRPVHLSRANTGESSTLSSANISQRLCHRITLHTAHKTMITHSALSDLGRGDVI